MCTLKYKRAHNQETYTVLYATTRHKHDKHYQKHSQFLDDVIFFSGLKCIYQLKDVWVVDPGAAKQADKKSQTAALQR